MKYCAKCGTALNDADATCFNCGTAQAPVAPVYTPPYNADPNGNYNPNPGYPPVYQPPYAPAPQPKSTVGANVAAGIGFGLVMLGFLFAFITFAMGVSLMDWYDEELLFLVFYFFFMFFPPALIGLILCGNGRKNGAGGLAVVGKVFGIISMVLYGLSFFMAIVSTM